MIALTIERADPVSSVFPRMRFVHFVKLVPKFSEVFFRDRIAAVKYAHADVIFFVHHPDRSAVLCRHDGSRWSDNYGTPAPS